MSIDELASQVREHIGKRVRISSSVVCNNRWELLNNVTVTDGTIWCHGSDGTSWAVVESGLQVDVEPTFGTFDTSSGPEQMRAVGQALSNYGLTPRQVRQLCHCRLCTEARDKKVETETPREERRRRNSEPDSGETRDTLFPDF